MCVCVCVWGGGGAGGGGGDVQHTRLIQEYRGVYFHSMFLEFHLYKSKNFQSIFLE